MSSALTSSPSVVATGGHTRILHNFLHGRRLEWKEEEETVRNLQATSKYWKVTAVVDGQPIGFGSGPRLRVAKDRAAREALIALGQIEESP